MFRESNILVSLLEEHGIGEGISGKRNLQDLNPRFWLFIKFHLKINIVILQTASFKCYIFTSVVKYKGKVDKEGKYHGEGEAW